MTAIDIDEKRRLSLLPAQVPWGIRQLCYAVRRIRGYGRILPLLARFVPALQEVTVESFFCGPMCLDFRELICLPIFVNGYYKHQYSEDRVLDHILREGMNVFDIGANIGYYTAFFSRRVKNQGQVVSIEPMPRAFRLLKKTASFSGANAIVVQAAIGPEPGEAVMHEMSHLDISYVDFGKGLSGSSIAVRTIDQLTEEFGMPDILKIDVEGAEFLALKGAQATLLHRSPPFVMIEYIPSNAAHFGGYLLADLLDYFPDDRFKAYRIVQPGLLQELDKDDRAATNDYLLVPREKLPAIASLLANAEVLNY